MFKLRYLDPLSLLCSRRRYITLFSLSSTVRKQLDFGVLRACRGHAPTGGSLSAWADLGCLLGGPSAKVRPKWQFYSNNYEGVLCYLVSVVGLSPWCFRALGSGKASSLFDRPVLPARDQCCQPALMINHEAGHALRLNHPTPSACSPFSNAGCKLQPLPPCRPRLGPLIRFVKLDQRS